MTTLDTSLASNISQLSLNENVLGFSQNLHDEIVKSKEILDAFVTRTKETVESIQELNRQGVSRDSAELQELLQELADIRSKIASVQDSKHSLSMQKIGLERERGAVLKDCKNALPSKLSEMKREERMHKQRAEEARLAKQRVAEHKEITKAELTRGVLEYKRLGIDYAKLSDRSKTRITFTKLDPQDIERKFYFDMSAVSGGDAENFKVVSSSPEIDPEKIGAIEDDANRVNSNDSITVLIFGMRKAFQNLI